MFEELSVGGPSWTDEFTGDAGSHVCRENLYSGVNLNRVCELDACSTAFVRVQLHDVQRCY